jgi:apolipoprotein D and lipocalin family protein
LPVIEQGLASRSFARRKIEPLPPVISAEHVDLERFCGTWYEIASLPASGSERGAQEAAATCVTSFAPIPGRRCLAVTRQYRLPDGRVRTRRGEAYVVEGSGNARLRISLLSRFLRCLPGVWRDYWILMTDDTYQTALVGTPDRRNLWLLSRTPALSAADEERLIDHARRQQFRTDALLRT